MQTRPLVRMIGRYFGAGSLHSEPGSLGHAAQAVGALAAMAVSAGNVIGGAVVLRQGVMLIQAIARDGAFENMSTLTAVRTAATALYSAPAELGGMMIAVGTAGLVASAAGLARSHLVGVTAGRRFNPFSAPKLT